MHYLHLKGLPAPIAFLPEADGLSELLVSVLKGWSAEISTSARNADPFLFVGAAGRPGIRIARPGANWTVVEPTSVSAVCTLVVEIVDAFVAASPGLGSLHAASVEFDGRVAVFLAGHRIGKSTLAVRLSAAGRRVFSDDILPIDFATGEAVATGCLPRLRLPVPMPAPAEFTTYVAAQTVLSDGYYCYVDAPDDARAMHSQRAPIEAVILLEREVGQRPAQLVDAPVEEALLNILLRDTRHSFDAERTLSGYHDLTRTATSWRLIYSDLEDAVRCLDEAFATWPQTQCRADAGEDHVRQEVGSFPVISSIRKTESYRRKRDVSQRAVGDAAFLLNPLTNEIHMLNTVGLAVWRLLEEPMDQAALVAAISAAFPDAPKEAIERDVAGLVSNLLQAGLITVLTGNDEV